MNNFEVYGDIYLACIRLNCSQIDLRTQIPLKCILFKEKFHMRMHLRGI